MEKFGEKTIHTYSLKFPFNFREDICVKQTEDTFAPAVTSLYINAKGIDKSEKAQEQVIFQWKKIKSNCS